MESRNPHYWRAFWITAAIVGGINVALFLYLAYLPDAPVGKGGRMTKPIPEWCLPAIVINFPGAVATIPFWEVMARLTSAAGFAVAQAISAAFWGGVAVAVEWFSCGKRSP